MTKQKKKAKPSLFYLDEQISDLIDNRCVEMGLNRTQYIEWLVNRDIENFNPQKAIKALDMQEKSEIDRHKEQMEEIGNRRKRAIYKLNYKNQFNKQVEKSVKIAIERIKRKIISNDPLEEIEFLAAHWAARLKKDKFELIYRAQKEIDKQLKSSKPR